MALFFSGSELTEIAIGIERNGAAFYQALADKAGNMVSVNQTLVNTFGSGVVIPGTGIVMNNAMYGLNPEPGTANSIDGRKRRIQNVCPTIVLEDGKG